MILFLQENMPPMDVQELPREYLQENARLALKVACRMNIHPPIGRKR